MNILLNFLLAIYVLVSLLMLLVILMQRPKSEGLGAAPGADAFLVHVGGDLLVTDLAG